MEFAKSDHEVRCHTIENLPANDSKLYLPFVMMSATVDSEGTQSLFVTPPVGLSVTNAQRSVIEISSHVKTEGWSPKESLCSETEKEFLRMLVESELPEREKKMMKKLFEQKMQSKN